MIVKPLMDFDKQTKLDTVASARTNTLIVIIVYCLFIFFDYLFYKSSVFYITFFLRIINIIILAIIFYAMRVIHYKYIDFLGLCGFGIASATICMYNVIIVNYKALPFWGSFTGINISLFLFIFVSSLNMPWKARYALILNLIATLTFGLTHFFFIADYPGIPLSMFLLISTSLIASIVSKKSYAYRLNDYKQKQDLQAHIKKLEKMISIQKQARKERSLRKELEVLNNKLQRLYKSREEFFFELSHEIRTPLTVILWKLDEAIEESHNDKVSLTLKEVQTINNYSKALIYKFNNILDLAQYDDSQKLPMSRYNLEEIFAEFIDEHSSMMKLKEVSFNLNSNLKSKESFIYCNRKEMDKVFFNLLHNSLKYMKRGGRIQIRLGEDKKNYTIEFKDNGIGIPKEKVDTILDKFSRVEQNEEFIANNQYATISSSGLGLALVKKAVFAHQGEISVHSKHISESSEEHGTVFRIKLKKGKKHFKGNVIAKLEKLEEGSSKYLEGRALANINSSEQSPTILIIDDNEEWIQFLEVAFSKQNYGVLIEESSNEGLGTALREKPDVIITDIAMPDMTGIELVRKLKSIKELSGIPIIIITGRFEEKDIPKDVRGMVSLIMQKPPSRRKLLEHVSVLTRNVRRG